MVNAPGSAWASRQDVRARRWPLIPLQLHHADSGGTPTTVPPAGNQAIPKTLEELEKNEDYDIPRP